MRTAAPRVRIDRATVVASARQLLDEEGMAGLSMAKLGQRLGVTGMALYRHVADRADLEGAVAESVFADLLSEPDAPGDWVEGIAAWMWRVRELWRSHPWLGNLLGSATQISPPWRATLQRLADLLEQGGLEQEIVARELVRISRATAGAVVLENVAPLSADGGFDGPLAKHIRRYGNDDLFADLVADVVARMRSTTRDRASATP
jgi:AcrR family transcriptional regulator